MVVEVVVRAIPNIEGFVHDDHADPVADLKQCQRRRIVRDAECVEARFLQARQLSLLRRRERSRTQNAVVVVDTAPAQLHRLAVQ